jgi:hypothetical protein
MGLLNGISTLSNLGFSYMVFDSQFTDVSFGVMDRMDLIRMNKLKTQPKAIMG